MQVSHTAFFNDTKYCTEIHACLGFHESCPKESIVAYSMATFRESQLSLFLRQDTMSVRSNWCTMTRYVGLSNAGCLGVVYSVLTSWFWALSWDKWLVVIDQYWPVPHLYKSCSSLYTSANAAIPEYGQWPSWYNHQGYTTSNGVHICRRSRFQPSSSWHGNREGVCILYCHLCPTNIIPVTWGTIFGSHANEETVASMTVNTREKSCGLKLFRTYLGLQ